MKIGIDISVLNDSHKTGIGVYTYQLIKNLLEINNQDKFVFFGISTLQTYETLKNIEFKNHANVELKIYRYPAKLFRTSFLLWQKFDVPTIEHFVGDVDIYHSFNWYLPPQKKGKKIATVFDMTPLLFPKFHHKDTVQLDKIRLNRIKKYADLVVTISENSKKDFLDFAPSKQVQVVYPAVGDEFKMDFKKQKIKDVLNKYKLDQGYILSVSTLEPRKNIVSLINAYLKTDIKDKLVLVGGEGWKSSDIFKLVEQNKDRIYITGFVEDEDLPIIYSQAKFFIYPSFYEGFGIPVLEALKIGTPVITSKISSLTEVAGEAALYIDPYDENSIKNAVLEMDSNETLRKDLIKKGFKQAEKFSWKKSAEQLNKIYQTI